MNIFYRNCFNQGGTFRDVPIGRDRKEVVHMSWRYHSQSAVAMGRWNNVCFLTILIT
jgi:hypothetical protein